MAKLKAYGVMGQLFNQFDSTTKIKEADIGILPGGSDWFPDLYDAPGIHLKTNYTKSIDLIQLKLLREYLENGLTILGICRGAQGLCIASGGALFQDVDNHHSTHQVFIKDPSSNDDKPLLITTNSCHHQMLDLSNLMEDYDYNLLAWSRVSNNVSGLSRAETVSLREPEMVSFPLIKGLGVQGHPEWDSMPSPYRQIMYNHLEILHESTSCNYNMGEVLARVDRMIVLLEKKISAYRNPTSTTKQDDYDLYEMYGYGTGRRSTPTPPEKNKKKDESMSLLDIKNA